MNISELEHFACVENNQYKNGFHYTIKAVDYGRAIYASLGQFSFESLIIRSCGLVQ